MTLSTGDTIQVILTVGGVPYAKTQPYDMFALPQNQVQSMFFSLMSDIDLYANEHEHEWHCTHDESQFVCLKCSATRPLICNEGEAP